MDFDQMVGSLDNMYAFVYYRNLMETRYPYGTENVRNTRTGQVLRLTGRDYFPPHIILRNDSGGVRAVCPNGFRDWVPVEESLEPANP